MEYREPVDVLPYLPPLDVHVGPVSISVFALLLGASVLVAIELAARRASSFQLVPANVAAFTIWVAVPALVLAHLVHALWHRPQLVAQDPSFLVDVTSGLSFVGGFVGACMGIALWRRLADDPVLPYLDAVASVAPIGWVVARLGCTVAHHHPGIRTTGDNPLAFAYPDGARWDLGLLELLLAALCSFALLALWQRPRPVGTYLAIVFLLYAPSRFALDFLRASPAHGGDPRYAGLTPAQWVCLLLLPIGLAAWRAATEERGRGRRAAPG